MMKKWLALCMTALLALTLLPAAAGAASTYQFDMVSSQIFLDPGGAPSATYRVLYNGSGTTTVVATLYDHVTGRTYGAGTYTAVGGERFELQNGAVELSTYNKPHRISIRLDDTNGGHGSITVYQTLLHGDYEGYCVMQEQVTNYYDNTACIEGPHFRDLRPSLTSKWYTFAAIDLTKQGRQTFDLIASNMYIIGHVYVDVKDDEVRVTYDILYAQDEGKTEITDEFFTFFHTLESVKTVEPEMINTDYAFGTPYSIEKDLEGDTIVLLMVRNRVNYCNYPNNGARLQRYWRNTKGYTERREAMMALLDTENAVGTEK